MTIKRGWILFAAGLWVMLIALATKERMGW
jgi:hypothetical protein